MKTSARNYFDGTVINIRRGAVNDEVEILLGSGNTRLTSTLPSVACKSIGIEPGSKVITIINGSSVVLASGENAVRFASMNNLEGTVVSVKEGGATAEVGLRLVGGEPLAAVIALDAVGYMGLKAGDKVTALIKESSVFVGVRK